LNATFARRHVELVVVVCSIARGEEGVGEVGKDDNGEGEVVESVGVSLGVQWTIAEDLFVRECAK
jgi:hypothetical protein